MMEAHCHIFDALAEVPAEGDAPPTARQRHVSQARVKIKAAGDTLKPTRQRHVFKALAEALTEGDLQTVRHRYGVQITPSHVKYYTKTMHCGSLGRLTLSNSGQLKENGRGRGRTIYADPGRIPRPRALEDSFTKFRLKSTPKVIPCRSLGSVTFWKLWLKHIPKVMLCQLRGSATSPKLCLTHLPKAMPRKPFGNITSFDPWPTSKPKVMLCESLGRAKSPSFG